MCIVLFDNSVNGVMLTLCRSVHNRVLDRFQLDISHCWTSLHIPFPAAAVLGDGMFSSSLLIEWM